MHVVTTGLSVTILTFVILPRNEATGEEKSDKEEHGNLYFRITNLAPLTTGSYGSQGKVL